jgi:murein DD-endopeptidase MepM/ murein hydrolase activator NlpD
MDEICRADPVGLDNIPDPLKCIAEVEMDFDFKPPRRSLIAQSFTKRRLSRPAVLVLLVLLAAGFLMIGRHSDKNGAQARAKIAPEQPPEPEIRREMVRGSIQPGETITSLLGHLFTPQEIYTLNQECKGIFPLSRLCAGQGYRLSLLNGAFESLEYDIDKDDQLIIRQGEEGFQVDRQPIPYMVREELVDATIMANLFDAVVSSGESEVLAINLADIFAWDVDFFRDIQPGDSFRALVEKRYREGKPAGYGRILAASFTNQGVTYQAFLYKDGERAATYYDEKGRSVRKAFLKAPLSFSRISSGFNMRRLHPITKRIQPHPAIDYAAPTGTPIMTVGEGTVTFAAYKRYNGNCVKVRHPGGWETMYNHMSRFGKGIRAGTKVRQGQVIGYVGTTGRSTGPHLDFRMYNNGRVVNPLKVKSPPALPVSAKNMENFQTLIAPLAARLENEAAGQTRLASTGQGRKKNTESEPEALN